MSKKESVTPNVTNEVSVNIDNLASQLSSALTVDMSKAFTKLDNGTEIAQKEYSFANPIGKKDKFVTYDLGLIQSMEKIDGFMKGRDILAFGICKELANIHNSKKLEKHGFKSIAEFGKAWKGLESSTINHYVKIGNSFLNDDYTLKSGLPQLSVSHLIELNSLVGENGDISGIINLYINGDLADGMSTKKIRETLQLIKSGKTITDNYSADTPSDDTPSADTPSAGTSSTDTSSVNDVINLEKKFDKQIAIGQILAHCNSIESIIEVMDKNDVFIDGIRSCLKMLIEDTKQQI